MVASLARYTVVVPVIPRGALDHRERPNGALQDRKRSTGSALHFRDAILPPDCDNVEPFPNGWPG
jgi:hypothetical protein